MITQVLSIMKRTNSKISRRRNLTQYIKTTTGRAILNYIIQKTLNLE
jgi:hypothetical protein